MQAPSMLRAASSHTQCDLIVTLTEQALARGWKATVNHQRIGGGRDGVRYVSCLERGRFRACALPSWE